jgi:hypothetical protein
VPFIQSVIALPWLRRYHRHAPPNGPAEACNELTANNAYFHLHLIPCLLGRESQDCSYLDNYKADWVKLMKGSTATSKVLSTSLFLLTD